MKEWLVKERRAKAGGIITHWKDSGIKGEKKAFAKKKEHSGSGRNSIEIVTKTKTGCNEFCFQFLNYYVEKKGHLTCKLKTFEAILMLKNLLSKIWMLNLPNDIKSPYLQPQRNSSSAFWNRETLLIIEWGVVNPSP